MILSKEREFWRFLSSEVRDRDAQLAWGRFEDFFREMDKMVGEARVNAQALEQLLSPDTKLNVSRISSFGKNANAGLNLSNNGSSRGEMKPFSTLASEARGCVGTK